MIVSCANLSIAQKRYNVGDLYDVHGKRGIVFYVDASGCHGKIISLDNKFACWSCGVYRDALVGMIDQDNGAINQRKIQSMSDWRRYFPAFAKCADYGPDWYLPAINELIQIYKVVKRLNYTLSMYNYDTLQSSYFSSTEHNANSVCQVFMQKGNVYEVYKDSPCYIRAITTF